MDFLPKKMIGIDFHDHSAELVDLRMVGGEVSLEAYHRIEIPPLVMREGEIKDFEELKKSIQTLLSNANPKPVDGKSIAVILPSSRTFTHLFVFPASLNETEIAKAITYEAETILPFSMKDVYWDFYVVEREDLKQKHASQYVLFVATLKTTTDQYAALLESMNLIPYLFTTQVESLSFALQNDLKENETTLVIDLGSLSVQYVFFCGKKVRYFFSSNKGGGGLIRGMAKDLKIPENQLMERYERSKLEPSHYEMMEDYLKEVYQQASMLMEENSGDARIGVVKKILITGEFLNIPRFYELAEQSFPNQCVEIGDPKKGLHVDAQKLLPLHQQRKSPVPYSIYFTNAIGVAQRALKVKPDDGINILPSHLKESIAHRKMVIGMVVATLGMMTFTMIMGTWMFFKFQSLMYDRLQWEIKKSAIENTLYGVRYLEIREEIMTFNEEVSELSQIDVSLFSVPTMMNTVYDNIPSGVELSEVSFNDDELFMELSGIADSRETLLELEGNLESLEFVEEVIAPISNYDQKSQISFIMKLKLDFTTLPAYGLNPSS